jgi:hypothetical protein
MLLSKEETDEPECVGVQGKKLYQDVQFVS